MKFVKTMRAKLNPATYPVEVMELPRTRAFYQNYPAPVTFRIPGSIKTISADEMQLLATWYLRGTKLQHNNHKLKIKHPIQQWNYEFVDALPQHYIEMGKTTPNLAYEYGKLLIDKCTKASRIPFSRLEQAYKDIMRTFWTSNTIFYSPNQKTYLEVKAEMETFAEIKDLNRCSELAKMLDYSDIELDYYCRVFGVEQPDWAIRLNYVHTDHGFAHQPVIDMTAYKDMSYQGSKTGYAGNEEREAIPFTLHRDSKPTELQLSGLRAKLCEQVEWFLNTFKATNDKSLLAEGWSYCTTCGFYQTSDSCTCGLCPSEADMELQEVQETYEQYSNQHIKHYQNTEGECQVKDMDAEDTTINGVDYQELANTLFALHGTELTEMRPAEILKIAHAVANW